MYILPIHIPLMSVAVMRMQNPEYTFFQFNLISPTFYQTRQALPSSLSA